MSDQQSVKCLVPGLYCSGTGACECKGAGVPSQTRALGPQGTASRDLAAMEEASAWVTSTYSRRVATESGIHQIM